MLCVQCFLSGEVRAKHIPTDSVQVRVLPDDCRCAIRECCEQIWKKKPVFQLSISCRSLCTARALLPPIPGSPWAAGIEPNTPQVHPSGKFLDVPNEGDLTISAYAIDPTTGALTPLAGSPFATGATGNT